MNLDRLSPEAREVMASISADMERALSEPRKPAGEAIADATRDQLRRIMKAMDYLPSEIDRAVDTVEALPTEPGAQTVNVTFTAPPRVVAYIDAVRAGDLDAAQRWLDG